MKYTDRFIELPIVIYNDKRLEKARKDEEEYELDEPMEVPFIVGRLKVLPSDITGYYQTWTRGVTFDEAREGRMDATVIDVASMGTFLIYLPVEKFERRLNEWMNSGVVIEEESAIT